MFLLKRAAIYKFLYDTFNRIYIFFSSIMIQFICCRTHSGNRKGVYQLEIVISFLVSVVAGIVSYYFCKWLDGDDSGI